MHNINFKCGIFIFAKYLCVTEWTSVSVLEMNCNVYMINKRCVIEKKKRYMMNLSIVTMCMFVLASGIIIIQTIEFIATLFSFLRTKERIFQIIYILFLNFQKYSSKTFNLAIQTVIDLWMSESSAIKIHIYLFPFMKTIFFLFLSFDSTQHATYLHRERESCTCSKYTILFSSSSLCCVLSMQRNING